MRQFDKQGSELCSFQAKIFAASKKKLICSSKIFLRRFYFSSYAYHLDNYNFYKLLCEEEECFNDLLEDYGDSTYGKIKLPEQILYYIGYISRYICYTREITSLTFYHTFGIDDLITNYEIFHTLNEEAVISELLKIHNLNEDFFDEEAKLNKLIYEQYSSN